MTTDRVRPLRGSSFDSFEGAVLQAIASASPAPDGGGAPRQFTVLQLSVELGGFVGRPQFIADVAPPAGPNV